MESASNLVDVEEEVVKMFTFREKHRREAEEHIAPIREEGCIPVGMHARRGDKSKQCCQPQCFQDDAMWPTQHHQQQQQHSVNEAMTEKQCGWWRHNSRPTDPTGVRK